MDKGSSEEVTNIYTVGKKFSSFSVLKEKVASF